VKHEKYKVTISNSFLDYEFYSVGPRGRILKRVEYKKVWGSVSDYNLSFGDVDKDDEIDDLVVTDNRDSKKILATVAFTVTIFMNKYPNKLVLVKGSTEARTRLYRIGISNNLEEIRDFLDIYGLNNGWKPFIKNCDYKAFMVTTKNSNFRLS
jgi:hypothetical protein